MSFLGKKFLQFNLSLMVATTAISLMASKVIAAGGPTPYSPYRPPVEQTGIAGLELLPVLGIVLWVVGLILIANKSVLLEKISRT